MYGANERPPQSSPNRRQLLGAFCAAGAASSLATLTTPHADAAQVRAVVNGRIKQSIVFWCFNTAGEKWDVERTCRAARELGCPSVEIVPVEQWGVLKKHKLICALAPNGMPGAPFVHGFNN